MPSPAGDGRELSLYLVTQAAQQHTRPPVRPPRPPPRKMGVGPSTQAAQQAQAPGPVQASGCPVVQGRRGQQPQQPQQPRSPFGAFGGAPGAAESTCPVVRQGQGQGQGAQAQQQTGTQPPAVRQQPQEQEQAVYNVYSERIDPRNRVPIGTNRPGISPQQSVPLSTGRVTSTIPKGGTDATWTYPSPQMFYNALQRKGKVRCHQRASAAQGPESGRWAMDCRRCGANRGGTLRTAPPSPRGESETPFPSRAHAPLRHLRHSPPCL